MGFPVPWRCLVPADAVEPVFGKSGPAGGSESGAVVKVSSEDEAPATLSDKILTLEGSAAEKEEACRDILRELWTSQGIPAEEDGVFVLVVPSSAIGAVIGTKGAKIKEIMEASGADINVGREPIIGMPDIPVVLTGLQAQVLVATRLANAVLQELADKERLRGDDFVYVPGRAAVAPRTPRSGASPHAARFVVSRGAAGFLIGRGGQKVRELREESGGAQIQLRGAEEEPGATLGEEERVVEVRGDAQQRDLGARAVLAAMEQMPDPPRETRLLVPADLERTRLETALSTASVHFDLAALGAPAASPDATEVVVSVAGSLVERAAGVSAALELLDAHLGLQPSEKPAEPQEALQRRAGAAREPGPPPAAGGCGASAGAAAAGGKDRDAEREDRRVEPESGIEYNFEEFQLAFAGSYTEADIRDYWRDACKPVVQVAGTRAGRGGSGAQAPGAAEEPAELSPAPPAPAERQKPAELPPSPPAPAEHQAQSAPASDGAHTGLGPPPTQPSTAPKPRGALPAGPEERGPPPPQKAGDTLPQPPSSFSGRASAPPPGPEERADPGLQQLPSPQKAGGTSPQPPSACNGFAPAPAPPPWSASAPGFGGSGCGVLGTFSSQPGLHPLAGMSFGGCQRSCLQLLLPAAAMRGRLAPEGHLAEIAQGCRVQIDLCEEASPGLLRVQISGTVVANSLAAVCLQWRLWFVEPAT